MASIVLFRFKDFGAKTAFDNLTQDVALHIVQAQKSAISGILNPNFTDTNNPPSYGMFSKHRQGTQSSIHSHTNSPTSPISQLRERREAMVSMIRQQGVQARQRSAMNVSRRRPSPVENT